jgi:hypothetical protein
MAPLAGDQGDRDVQRVDFLKNLAQVSEPGAEALRNRGVNLIEVDALDLLFLFHLLLFFWGRSPTNTSTTRETTRHTRHTRGATRGGTRGTTNSVTRDSPGTNTNTTRHTTAALRSRGARRSLSAALTSVFGIGQHVAGAGIGKRIGGVHPLLSLLLLMVGQPDT